jgi:plastocyanin
MDSPNFTYLGRKFLVVAALLLVIINAWADAQVHKVSIDAMKFSPEQLEVNLGDRIQWANTDPFPHNVTSSDGILHSAEIGPAKSWEFTPKKKGTYHYICSLHPTMKATLIVK